MTVDPAAVGLLVLAGVLGLAVGSFANVLVARVPAGRSIAKPGSACPVCGHPIRARDNVPVVSWLILRGHCRDCGAVIPWRYPALELLTAALFVLVTAILGPDWSLPAWLFLIGVGVPLAAIDLEHRRLPDALTLPSYPIAIALLVVAAAGDGHWWGLGRALAAAVALFAFYLLPAVIYPAGMGFGDVKLAGVLGLYLGWLGWGEVVVGTMAAFMLGAVVGLIVLASGRGGRRTAVPFGPFMLVGVLLAFLVGPEVVMWYTGLLSG